MVCSEFYAIIKPDIAPTDTDKPLDRPLYEDSARLLNVMR